MVLGEGRRVRSCEEPPEKQFHTYLRWKGAPGKRQHHLPHCCWPCLGGVIEQEGQEMKLLLINTVQGTVRVCSCPRGRLALQSLRAGCEGVLTLPIIVYMIIAWESGERGSDGYRGEKQTWKSCRLRSWEPFAISSLLQPSEVSRATAAAPRPCGTTMGRGG